MISVKEFCDKHGACAAPEKHKPKLEWKEIGGTYTWNQAIELGKDGWRLPTKEELLSLRKVKLIPSGNWYWSLCPGADNNNSAWYVNLSYGYENYGRKYDRYNVRLVRELT